MGHRERGRPPGTQGLAALHLFGPAKEISMGVRHIGMVGLLAVVAVPRISGAQRSAEVPPGVSGKIVFAANPDGRGVRIHGKTDGITVTGEVGDWDIYMLDLDTGDVNCVLAGLTIDCAPAFDPEGARIAFMRNVANGPTFALFSMNADGTGLARLTRGKARGLCPSWSPDGEWLAYQSSGDLWVMPVGSQGKPRLLLEDAEDPCWHPEEGLIAFTSDRDGAYDIYTMDRDSGTVSRLTGGEDEDREPAWSPDGRRIAFRSNRDGNDEIYTVDLAEGNVVRLTDNDGEDRFPTWSPDGAWIAFLGECDGVIEVMAVAADGSRIVQLTHGLAAGTRISWARGR